MLKNNDMYSRWFLSSDDELIDMEYSPCGNCNPI